MKLLYAILTSLLLSTTAIAHDWFPTRCCGGEDCRPIACEDVPSDYKYKGIPFREVLPSEDNKCYSCIRNNIPYCLFIQMNS